MDTARFRQQLSEYTRSWCDEELYGFVLFECAGTDFLEAIDADGLRKVFLAFKSIRENTAGIITEDTKRFFRGAALDLIVATAVNCRMTRFDVRALAASIFGVSAVEWLALDELGELLAAIRARVSK